jgi:hypothetical protein
MPHSEVASARLTIDSKIVTSIKTRARQLSRGSGLCRTIWEIRHIVADQVLEGHAVADARTELKSTKRSRYDERGIEPQLKCAAFGPQHICRKRLDLKGKSPPPFLAMGSSIKKSGRLDLNLS